MTSFRDVELPQGIFEGLPEMFSYVRSEMLDDPQSGCGAVVVTEWDDRVSCFLLQEFYDSFQLWKISPTLIWFIRKLDLTFSLGLWANVEELRLLLVTGIVGR